MWVDIRLQCLNLRILFSQLEQIYIIKQFVNAAGHLVERTGEPDGVTTTGLKATPSGERYAEMSNRELAKFLIESVSSGIMQGTLSFFETKAF